MKKETIIAAIVFFAVGFLAGTVFEHQRRSESQESQAAAREPSSQTSEIALPEGHPPIGPTGSARSANSANPSDLPEGHPPVDSGADVLGLKDEAAKRPRDPEPPLKLANFYYDQKQYGQAIEWYEKALELDPTNVNARTDLGTAYFYTGRPEEAVSEYRRSLQTDPTHQPTLFNLVLVNLDGTHDLAAARQALERLEKLNSNYPQLDSLKRRLETARASAPPSSGRDSSPP